MTGAAQQPSMSTARSLAAVLRSLLPQDTGVRLIVGEVISTPDSTRVGLSLNGAPIIVPHLESYTPTVGDACYVLVQGARMLALGAVR